LLLTEQRNKTHLGLPVAVVPVGAAVGAAPCYKKYNITNISY